MGCAPLSGYHLHSALSISSTDFFFVLNWGFLILEVGGLFSINVFLS